MKPYEKHILLSLFIGGFSLIGLSFGIADSSEDGDDAKNDVKTAARDFMIADHDDGTSLHFTSAADAILYMKKSPHWDDYRRGILPRMTGDDLDYAERLINNPHDGFIVVDKGRMKVIKYNRYGDEVVSYGMACAKNYGNKHHHNDCRTPEGFFTVRGVHNSESWHYIDENGNASEREGEFGPRFIRLNTPLTRSIGIHGTCAPWSIGARRSHGCVRIKNENILHLVEMVDSGMPVIITPGPKDMAVNASEGDPVPSISTLPG